MTSNLSENIEQDSEIAGRGVSEDFVYDERREPAFDNINVVIRVRPASIPSTSSSHAAIAERRDQSLQFPAAGQIQVLDPIAGHGHYRSFTFNVVFEPEATQQEVFEHSGVKRLIDMSLDGFACTVLAYGQTSSGKTFTLTGNAFQQVSSENLPTKGNPNDGGPGEKKIIGIVQLAFAYLFEQIKLRKNRSIFYIIHCSYLEVYNEQVLDLLNPSPKSLNVRWAKDRGFYAENLFKVECEDIGDLEGVLEEGCKNRQVRAHSMNENSSRSHSVLTITLSSETQDPEDPQGYIRREGRLCLVDLAGSEKTKRTNSKGDTLVEANNINRSLLVLGNCISALADPKRRSGHIPYRDSTLTKLLADSLSGSGLTLMIACVSTLKIDAFETINTLRYASRAKKVKTNPIVRMDPRELLILSLKREVRLLRMENNYLRQQLNLGSGFLLTSNNNNNNNNHHNQVNGRPTSDSSNASQNDAESSKNKEMELHQDLLNKYMQENEALRAENAQLHQQRERLIHDHELVCRENERLLKRVAAAGQHTDNIQRPSMDDQSAVTVLSANRNGKKQMLDDRGKAKLDNNQHKNSQQTKAIADLDPSFELRGTSAAARSRIIRRSNNK